MEIRIIITEWKYEFNYIEFNYILIGIFLIDNFLENELTFCLNFEENIGLRH